jgi:2-oxo-3-hexenedioate decarboxylase/2-keto-4-pentenoate hydratase
MAALCEALSGKQGGEPMALSIARVANWLAQVGQGARGGRPLAAQFETDDERLAYKVQDAFLKKQVVRQGPLAGYKIALNLAADPGADRAERPLLRPDPQEARVRAQGDGARRPLDSARRRARGRLRHRRQRARTESQALRPGLDRPIVGEARAGFELIEDRGADYSRLAVNPLIMDAGWNGGSLLAKPNKDWRKLPIDKLDGSISFDGTVVRTGHSGDVLGHPYNALAWLANKLGEHGKTLKKGMIVSSGSMVACQFVPPGSTATGKIEGLGEVTLKYELPK